MTYQHAIDSVKPASADSVDAGAPADEIEITPAMIEAGAAEVAMYSPETTDAASVAEDVFKAMLRASRRPSAKPLRNARQACAA